MRSRIYLDSRYATGTICKVHDARNNSRQIAVYRCFPQDSTAFFWYVWTKADRLDSLAQRYLGDFNLWWRIMDFNPEIIDPAVIAPGTQLRVPNA